MDTDHLRAALAGTRFADVRWVAATGSTNHDLLEAARAGAPEGAVLVADHQDAGRGRLGRSWEAPDGSSLLVSVLVRPELPPDEVWLTATALGVAAAEAVAEVTGIEAGLKWPNDLVVDRDGATRKLGGILAESVLAGDRVEAVVVGIGLNCNWPADLPPELAEIAVSANHLTGAEVSRQDLLEALLRHFDTWYGRLERGPARETLLHHYRDRSATVGRRVRVETAGETIEGTAVEISHGGHLRVEVDGEAEPLEITAGDVVHLRPTD